MFYLWKKKLSEVDIEGQILTSCYQEEH